MTPPQPPLTDAKIGMNSEPDDAEWDRWMSLTDEQMEAELAQAMAEFNRWFDALTPLQQWKYRVSKCSKNLICQKTMLAKYPWMTWLARNSAKIERRLEKLLKEKPGARE